MEYGGNQIDKDKSYNIQLLRGLAIIAVVCIHNSPSGIGQVVVRPFINFGVALFLFLSGYLSHATSWKPWKRIKKVAIPYILWNIVYTAISYHDNLARFPVGLVKNLLIASGAAVMYYIFIYVQFTLLIPVIDSMARSKFKWVGFLITPAEIITMRLIPLIMGIEVNRYISIIMGISCLGWFTYYYLGYLIGNNLIEINLSKSKVLVLWIIAMCLQFAEGYWQFSKGIENCGTQLKLSSILTGVFFCIGALYFMLENTKKVKWLKLIGDISFGIYFSHLAVMSVLNKIPHYSDLFFLIRVVIVVCICTVMILVVKKILGKKARYLAF